MWFVSCLLKFLFNGEIINIDQAGSKIDKKSPVFAKRLLIDGTERLVEVFCYAILVVKIKIHIDGEFYSGDEF